MYFSTPPRSEVVCGTTKSYHCIWKVDINHTKVKNENRFFLGRITKKKMCWHCTTTMSAMCGGCTTFVRSPEGFLSDLASPCHSTVRYCTVRATKSLTCRQYRKFSLRSHLESTQYKKSSRILRYLI